MQNETEKQQKIKRMSGNTASQTVKVEGVLLNVDFSPKNREEPCPVRGLFLEVPSRCRRRHDAVWLPGRDMWGFCFFFFLHL